MQVEGCTILGKRRDFKAESICSIDGTQGESEVTVDGEKHYRQMGDFGGTFRVGGAGESLVRETPRPASGDDGRDSSTASALRMNCKGASGEPGDRESETESDAIGLAP